MKLGVQVVYRNAKMQPVCEKHYDLDTYLELMKSDLLRIITDVEDVIYQSNGCAAKEEWPDAVWLGFSKIKHKILDKAGDISRLAENIYEIKEEEEHGKDSLGQARKYSGCDSAHSSCSTEEHEGFSSTAHD